MAAFAAYVLESNFQKKRRDKLLFDIKRFSKAFCVMGYTHITKKILLASGEIVRHFPELRTV
jgi:hypothetical protein